MVYSVVKRHKCHTKELRDILDTLSDTSYDVDISAQMTEKHPSDYYLNGSFDPSEGKTPPDDLSHWYRSSLLIQVVPEGQTHTLMVSDLHPTPDTESVDDLYSQILRGKHNEGTAPEGHWLGYSPWGPLIGIQPLMAIDWDTAPEDHWLGYSPWGPLIGVQPLRAISWIQPLRAIECRTVKNTRNMKISLDYREKKLCIFLYLFNY